MKRIILILSILIATKAVAQTSFKQLYSSLHENDRFSNLMALQEYRSHNPEHAAAFFLIAELYTQYIEETNPLTMFSFIEINFREASVNYQLAKFKLDKAQARRDRDYFGQLELISGKSKSQYEDIVYEIDKRTDSLNNYYNHAKSVHDNYIRCINKYNECLFKFRKILSTYPNYKNMYLFAGESLVSDIKKLVSDFDSSLVFFNSYKESCILLPHLLQVNNYELKPIITYRLEGLTETDFTQPVVPLWDFKTWANNFLTTIENDILHMREEMTNTDIQLNKQINRLKNVEVYNNGFDLFYPDVKFQNLIGKYDYASLANKLFNYKKSKTRFLARTRETINDPVNIEEGFLINRLIFYKELAFQKESVNDEARTLQQSISLNNIEKYLDFFNNRYNGMDGLTRWCVIEQYDNNEVLKKNLFNLDKFLRYESSKHNYSDSVLKYQNQSIALGIQHPEFNQLYPDTFIITHFSSFLNKWGFQSGFYIDKDSIKHSFSTKINHNGIEWLNKFKLKREKRKIQSEIISQQILDDSCMVTLNHVKGFGENSDFSYNIIEKTNWKGKIIQQLKIPCTDYPRYFYADEINEQYVIVTHRDSASHYKNSPDTLTALITNFDNTLIWKKQFVINGEFVDISFSNANLFLSINSSYYNDLQGHEFQSDKLQQNAMLIFITREGVPEKLYSYNLSTNLKANTFKKISSNLLHLSGNIESKDNANNFFYLLIDMNGTPVFSSEKNMICKKVVLN